MNEKQNTIFVDVTPLSVGFEETNGLMKTVIPVGTIIPCKASVVIQLCRDQAGQFTLAIFQGVRPIAKSNPLLGRIRVKGIPEQTERLTTRLEFQVDVNGFLYIMAYDMDSGRSLETEKVESFGLSMNEVDAHEAEARQHQRRNMNTAKEYRTLQFRCAETGKRFQVSFSRYSPKHKFQIVFIEDEDSNRVYNVSREVASTSSTLMNTNRPDSEEYYPATVENPRSPQSFETPVTEPEHVPSKTTSDRPGSAHSFQVTDFDFSGWYCLHCGHAQHGTVLHMFIECGKCGEYVCGARVRQIEGGAILFACHDGCGSGGRIEGQIAAYTGTIIDSSGNVPSRQSSGEPGAKQLTGGGRQKSLPNPSAKQIRSETLYLPAPQRRK
jgi:hypothetical protein